MAPLPPVPRVLKVRIHGNFATAVPWAVLDHYRYSGLAPTNSDLNGWAGAIGVAISAHLVQNWANDTSVTGVDVQDLTSPTSAVGGDGTIRPGTGGALDLPDSVCVLESKKGSLRYRGGHSRTYWPGLGAAGSNASGNSWGATQIETWATALGLWIDAVLADGNSRPFGPLQRCIIHYRGKHPEITYPFVEDVVASETLTPMASQRRRLGR